MPVDPSDVAVQFNDTINDRDLSELEELMTVDHCFIDTSGTMTRGRAANVDNWRGFFEQFPDYENVFTSVTATDDVVTMVGRSNCSDDRLQGPAIWTARVREGNVSEWRVYEDTPDNRKQLGIADSRRG